MAGKATTNEKRARAFMRIVKAKYGSAFLRGSEYDPRHGVVVLRLGRARGSDWGMRLVARTDDWPDLVVEAHVGPLKVDHYGDRAYYSVGSGAAREVFIPARSVGRASIERAVEKLVKWGTGSDLAHRMQRSAPPSGSTETARWRLREARKDLAYQQVKAAGERKEARARLRKALRTPPEHHRILPNGRMPEWDARERASQTALRSVATAMKSMFGEARPKLVRTAKWSYDARRYMPTQQGAAVVAKLGRGTGRYRNVSTIWLWLFPRVKGGRVGKKGITGAVVEVTAQIRFDTPDSSSRRDDIPKVTDKKRVGAQKSMSVPYPASAAEIRTLVKRLVAWAASPSAEDQWSSSQWRYGRESDVESARYDVRTLAGWGERHAKERHAEALAKYREAKALEAATPKWRLTQRNSRKGREIPVTVMGSTVWWAGGYADGGTEVGRAARLSKGPPSPWHNVGTNTHIEGVYRDGRIYFAGGGSAPAPYSLVSYAAKGRGRRR